MNMHMCRLYVQNSTHTYKYILSVDAWIPHDMGVRIPTELLLLPAIKESDVTLAAWKLHVATHNAHLAFLVLKLYLFFPPCPMSTLDFSSSVPNFIADILLLLLLLRWVGGIILCWKKRMVKKNRLAHAPRNRFIAGWRRNSLTTKIDIYISIYQVYRGEYSLLSGERGLPVLQSYYCQIYSCMYFCQRQSSSIQISFCGMQIYWSEYPKGAFGKAVFWTHSLIQIQSGKNSRLAS